MLDRERNRMFVVPARDYPGYRVRMFHRPTEILPLEGAWVPMSAAWLRALKGGDVALASPTASLKSKPKNRAAKPLGD